jgi:transcriptional regulator with XRE-family HTH domain
MPAIAPPIGDHLAATLSALGQRLRARRKALGVSATTAAEAASMSRVTLHRIEGGEPSVTMGAYLSAAAALGLSFALLDPQDPGGKLKDEQPVLPASIALSDYPQLKRLAWHLHGTTELTPKEALALYERNWRHVDPSAMDPRERALVKALARDLGGGRLLV